MVEIDRREFKRRFPNLAEEIESRKGTFDIANVDGVSIVEKAHIDSFAGHIPTAIDYLRRCDNDEQAEITINYLEKKGEITHEYADQLRQSLREHGIRGFGPKKEDDYYLRKAGYG